MADGLRLVLAYDLPTRVVIPAREDVLEWGEEDELFERALAQTRAEPGLEVMQHDSPEGEATLWSLSGESFFAATHILWAEDFLPLPCEEHGALVAAPNRHTALAHPIRDLTVVHAVSMLLLVAEAGWRDGPGSISRQVYWRRDDAFQPLQVHEDSKGVTFAPSDDFMQVLNRLD